MKSIRSNKYTILLFVAVPMLIYVFFALIPILYNIYISLFDTNLLTPGKFVGLKNYARLLKDTTFLRALRNNIFLVIGSLAAHMGLGLFFANAIFQKVKGSKFFQSVFFLPSVICGVAVGLIWTFVYHGNYGLLNAFLKLIGQGDLQQVWLSNKNLALICIIVVVMWQWVGYHVVIQLAAMRNIPQELYEAAQLDGASEWQQFKNITVPLIRPILKVDAVLIITGALKYYDLVAVMTNGGPNHATEVMSTYMYYEAFNVLKFGYSSAIGVVLLILCMSAVMLTNKVFKTENYME
jgi:raffinose/stachyose/melibiose transport system permease protein